MPSRELGERWPNLLAVGGHPAVDMPPHVVEAATARGRARAVRADARAAGAARGDRELPSTAVDPERNVLVTLGGMQGLYLAARAFGQRAVVARAVVLLPAARSTAAGGHVRRRPYDWDEYAAARRRRRRRSRS